jgi:hypothetical protein
MQPIVTLTGGAATLFGQQSQTLSSDGTLFKYHPNNSLALKFLAGGFVGEEYAFNKIWAWQFGLAFYQIANTSS